MKIRGCERAGPPPLRVLPGIHPVRPHREPVRDDGGQASPDDQGAQDWADAQALYTLLEQQVIPAFYDRDAQGLPRRWLQVVKQSIRTVLPRFSARRMVKEYAREMYGPALRDTVGAR